MKVHYEEHIIDKLANQIARAHKENRKIEYIELTSDEWSELTAHTLTFVRMYGGVSGGITETQIKHSDSLLYDGVIIKKETK